MLPAWFPRLYFHRQISYTYIEKHLWNMLDKSNQNPHTATSFHSNNYWKSKVLQTLFNYTTFRVRLRAAAFAASLAALRRSSPYGAVRRNLNLTFCRVSGVRRGMGNPIHCCHSSLLTIEKPTFSTPILILNPSYPSRMRADILSLWPPRLIFASDE